MSRSSRKTPICGITTAESDKRFKRQESKRRRVAERAGKEFAPQSWGDKDGKQWLGNRHPDLMRK